MKIYVSPETAKYAEERARKKGKPFPKVVLIQAEWLRDYRKYKKLYEGLMRESEGLLCLFRGDAEGFHNTTFTSRIRSSDPWWWPRRWDPPIIEVEV